MASIPNVRGTQIFSVTLVHPTHFDATFCFTFWLICQLQLGTVAMPISVRASFWRGDRIRYGLGWRKNMGSCRNHQRKPLPWNGPNTLLVDDAFRTRLRKVGAHSMILASHDLSLGLQLVRLTYIYPSRHVSVKRTEVFSPYTFAVLLLKPRCTQL